MGATTTKLLREIHPLAIHRRNNLVLTLILPGKLAEARQILAANWRLNAPPHANTTPRLAFLRHLIALLIVGIGKRFKDKGDALRADRLLTGQRPRNKPAQGNALGNRITTGKALKGRDNGVVAGCPALSGLTLSTGQTQGVALGWLVAAPLVLAEFLTALVTALNDRAKLPDLDRFPEWRNQPPVPLDAPCA